MIKKLLFLSLIFGAHLSYGQYSGTPLMLSLPMNQDTIEEDEPVFVWQTTLSNLQSDPRLNVQLAVVEIEEDQTPAEAIVENTPVFIRQNLLSNTLNYSSIDHELEEGVWYAWQVVLFYNGVQVQQSEAWKFIKAEPVEPVSPFIVLRKKADNSMHKLSGEKVFVCTTERGDFDPHAVLTGKNANGLQIEFTEVDIHGEPLPSSAARLETRYYVCDLSNLDLGHGTYRIEWKASKKVDFLLSVQK